MLNTKDSREVGERADAVEDRSANEDEDDSDDENRRTHDDDRHVIDDRPQSDSDEEEVWRKYAEKLGGGNEPFHDDVDIFDDYWSDTGEETPDEESFLRLRSE